MTRHFVQLKLGNKTSAEGCEYVADFKESIKTVFRENSRNTTFLNSFSLKLMELLKSVL
jgi:hypothetical protein